MKKLLFGFICLSIFICLTACTTVPVAYEKSEPNSFYSSDEWKVIRPDIFKDLGDLIPLYEDYLGQISAPPFYHESLLDYRAEYEKRGAFDAVLNKETMPTFKAFHFSYNPLTKVVYFNHNRKVSNWNDDANAEMHSVDTILRRGNELRFMVENSQEIWLRVNADGSADLKHTGFPALNGKYYMDTDADISTYNSILM